MELRSQALTALALCAGLLALCSPALGIVLEDDPARNLTRPSDADGGTAWDLQGTWGSWLGTPVGARYFVTASHVGGSSNWTFNIGGTGYTIDTTFGSGGKGYIQNYDLRLWRITGTFANWAYVYSGTDEVGMNALLLGRGTPRGQEVVNGSGTVVGWKWGATDGAMSWGMNVISGTRNTFGYGSQLEYDFDADGVEDEGMVTTGDSSGGVFVKIDKIWALIGLESTADCHYATSASGSNAFYATLTDSRGFYLDDGAGNWSLITGSEPVPSQAQPTRISTRISWLQGYVSDLHVVPEPTALLMLFAGAAFVRRRARKP